LKLEAAAEQSESWKQVAPETSEAGTFTTVHF